MNKEQKKSLLVISAGVVLGLGLLLIHHYWSVNVASILQRLILALICSGIAYKAIFRKSGAKQDGAKPNPELNDKPRGKSNIRVTNLSKER